MASHGLEIERPWSQLPTELLSIISRNLTEIADYIAYRSVCPSWRSSAGLKDLPPQLPRLLLPFDPDTGVCSFFSLTTRKVSTFVLPECCGKSICGSGHGWLALVTDNSSITLWNPITRAQIPLPPPTQFPDYLGTNVSRFEQELEPPPGVEEDEIDESYWDQEDGYPGSIRDGYPWKVYWSTNPADPDTDCIVAVPLVGSLHFAYCRPGDEAWTILHDILPFSIVSVAFHKGRVYGLDFDGSSVVLDLDAGPSSEPTVIEPPFESVLTSHVYDLNGEFVSSEFACMVDLEVILSGNHNGCKADFVNTDWSLHGNPKADVCERYLFNIGRRRNNYKWLPCQWEGTGKEPADTTAWFTPSLR